VQGVFYRASTREVALKHNVSGYAYNLSDGSVEVLLCGEQADVDQVAAWLWDGPEFANVDSVICQDLPFEAQQGFSTG
jgi:acylphosphatase